MALIPFVPFVPLVEPMGMWTWVGPATSGGWTGSNAGTWRSCTISVTLGLFSTFASWKGRPGTPSVVDGEEILTLAMFLDQSWNRVEKQRLVSRITLLWPESCNYVVITCVKEQERKKIADHLIRRDLGPVWHGDLGPKEKDMIMMTSMMTTMEPAAEQSHGVTLLFLSSPFLLAWRQFDGFNSNWYKAMPEF